MEKNKHNIFTKITLVLNFARKSESGCRPVGPASNYYSHPQRGFLCMLKSILLKTYSLLLKCVDSIVELCI